MNREKAGFSLIELLVVIAIIAILAAILFPVFITARNKGQGSSCLGNMRQVGTAHMMYMDDYSGVLVPIGVVNGPPARIYPGSGATYWPDLISSYTKGSKGIHKCPTAKTFGLGMNHPQLGRWRTDLGVPVCRYSSIAHPDKTVCFADTGLVVNVDEKNPDRWREDIKATFTIVFRTPDNVGYYDVAGTSTRIINRHCGQANCVFLDGRAVATPVSQVGFQYPYGHRLAMWDDR